MTVRPLGPRIFSSSLYERGEMPDDGATVTPSLTTCCWPGTRIPSDGYSRDTCIAGDPTRVLASDNAPDSFAHAAATAAKNAIRSNAKNDANSSAAFDLRTNLPRDHPPRHQRPIPISTS